jgi:hypothetical protein
VQKPRCTRLFLLLLILGGGFTILPVLLYNQSYMQGLDTIIQGGRPERQPSLDDVRLNDGSPVHYAFLKENEGVVDKSSLQDSKSIMRALFEADKEFVLSLQGLSASDVVAKVEERMKQPYEEKPVIH